MVCANGENFLIKPSSLAKNALVWCNISTAKAVAKIMTKYFWLKIVYRFSVVFTEIP